MRTRLEVIDGLEAAGQVERYLGLADKAMTEGEFEKAEVYVALASAWQVEREYNDRQNGVTRYE